MVCLEYLAFLSPSCTRVDLEPQRAREKKKFTPSHEVDSSQPQNPDRTAKHINIALPKDRRTPSLSLSGVSALPSRRGLDDVLRKAWQIRQIFTIKNRSATPASNYRTMQVRRLIEYFVLNHRSLWSRGMHAPENDCAHAGCM